jgi:hypothetical protein
VIVDVILPRLNEAPALPWILERMPAGNAAAAGRRRAPRSRFAARARELATVLSPAGPGDSALGATA